MFHGKEKIFIGLIIFLIIAIPVGSFFLSQRLKAQKDFNSVADASPVTQPKEVPKNKPLDALKKQSTSSASKSSSSDTGSLSLGGPNLSFKLSIEGRPVNKMATKLFVGIAQGTPDLATQPTYLLTFNVDVPDSGAFSGVSLAGLNTLETYTAILKGTTQIATSSAFTVKPTTSDLGTVNLLTGDVNEDNVINSSDYSIVKNAMGLTPSSQTWNANFDFNLDNIINNFDIGYIFKNFGKTGASGPWYSKAPQVASQSGTLKSPSIGGPNKQSSSSSEFLKIPSDGGSWIWIPE